MMEYKDIIVETVNAVTQITLNRPEKLNAWTPTMGNEVKNAVENAGADKKCRCIVVTGAGRGFCAGADVGNLKDRSESGRTSTVEVDLHHKITDFDNNLGPDISKNFSGRFSYMYRCPKPIIAIINGPCAGVGLIFALYADMRFVASEAKLTTSFSSRGLIAEHGVAWILPRLIGEANALDLLITSRVFLGDEAFNLGLVNKAIPRESLEEYVAKITTDLVQKVSSRSIAIIKRQVRDSYFRNFNESLKIADSEMVKSFTDTDFKEGVASFIEKRPPNFKAIGAV